MHKKGGVFRDLQLHQQRIRKAIETNKNIAYDTADLIKPEVKETKKTKEELLSIKEFADSEKKIRNHLPDGYNKNTTRRFFQENLAVILDIIQKGRYSDKELHDIRKKLKDILYIIKLFKEDIGKPMGFRFWNAKELQQVKDLEDLLGFYNDACNALGFLKMRDINNHKEQEKKLLLSVRREVVAEKRKLRLQVLEGLKIYYNIVTRNA